MTDFISTAALSWGHGKTGLAGVSALIVPNHGPASRVPAVALPSGLVSWRGQGMLGYLDPREWYDGLVVPLMQQGGMELDQLDGALELGLSESFAATAVGYGLDLLEAEFGLPANASLTVAQRQSRLLAVMPGPGLTTVGSLKALLQSYGVTASVIEDAPANALTIVFQTALDPVALAQVQNTALAVIPARLSVTWVVPTNNYGQIKTRPYTYGQLKSNGWTYGQLKTVTL